MFTWIPIHEETAKRLLDFKDRSHELAALVVRMHEKGLKALPANDKDKDGNTVPLADIDPFTFLAGFNRAVRDDNRKALWQFLKDEWNLASPVPEDFDGLPVANLQNSWMFPYEKDRKPDHLPLLWQFFEHIMEVEPSELDASLMDRCLAKPGVGLAFLTMGMFWACPKKWIATDGKNLGFAATKGVADKLRNASDYIAWLPKIRAVIGGDGVEFSRQAHLWATGGKSTVNGYGSPFNRMFPSGEADSVLDVFADALEVVQEEIPESGHLLALTFGTTTRAVPQLVLNIGMWAVLWYENHSGGMRFGFLLPADHPEILKQGVTGQLSDKPDGKGYAHAKLPAAEFLERYDELWPAIRDAIRVACGFFANRKGTPYLRFHRPELVSLVSDPTERPRLLKEGIPTKSTVTETTGERRYWLLAPGEGAKYWDEWQDQGIAALDAPDYLGDLSKYSSRESIIAALNSATPGQNNNIASLMLWNISHEIQIGDIVFAKLGRSELIGWGEVASAYSFSMERGDYNHTIAVDWKVIKPVKVFGRKLAFKALTDISRMPILRSMLGDLYPGVPGLSDEMATDGDDDEGESDASDDAPIMGGRLFASYTMDEAIAELFLPRHSLEHILEQLKRKKNIILQGAPGVGKTFIAKRLAWLLLGGKDESAVEMVQFHQSYTYEDFVQGLRPTKDGHFAVKDGCFYRLCRKALANPRRDYFLVIDEINRGNLSKILGELMMLIETDKRGESLTLAYSEEPFTVPPNLYLIGTMNTADRSLSLVDYALRRRFAFLSLDPGFGEKTFAAHLERQGLTSVQIHFVRAQMEALNQEIEKDEANLGRGYRIGHSFFTPTTLVPDFQKWWQSIVRYEIMPLLEEYWIDDPKMVQQFRLSLTESLP